jgi:hypothetical protein
VGWVTRVQFLAGAMMGFFLFTTVSKLDLGPIQPPFQQLQGGGAPLISMKCRDQECVGLYVHSPIYLHGMMLN